MGRDGDPGTFGDASRAVKHMNDDHIDSLVAWAHYYLNVPAHITDVALVDCTEEGFHFMVEGVWRMIPYPAECKCDSARDLRKVAIYMHNEAFAKLGLAYRLRSGYYKRAALMGSSFVLRKVQRNRHVVIPAVALSALAIAYYRRRRR
mmetsp:Transcript_6185/g.22133  ORF Transcript_6185/g.22133 Transcript_6185/m.22133 type:complete len:148 (-) Transcript_6185:94-537(-)